MGAYRTADDAEVLEAPTREGLLRLEVAPRHVALALRAVQVAITDEFVTITERLRRRIKRRSERLGGPLVVARDVPREDVGLWLEVEPGTVRRIFGAAPHDLIAADGLSALRALDRLSGRLRQVLGPHGRGARRAWEIGPGLDKVLVVEHDDHIVVYARRLFRDRARRVVEVHADGTVIIPRASRTWPHRATGEDRFRIHERWGVTVTGDLLRFIDRAGNDLGQVAFHWIEPEDRLELARRFGDYIERGRAAAEPVMISS